MDTGPIEDILEENFRKFGQIPPDAHLLCPKIHEDDFEDYDDVDSPGEEITAIQKKERVEEWKKRLDIVYWTSLLLSYGKDKAGVWLEEWGNRMAINLHNCDKCVLNWHMYRKKYLAVFSESFAEAELDGIEKSLHTFDFDRIDKGLQWAKDIIEKVEGEGRAFSRADLGEDQGAVLLTVYEALCCMAYVSLPDKRQLFQYVFVRLSGKKPLKLGDNVLLPAMTTFLFGEDRTRLQFAEKSWERLRPKSLTLEQFNWAVHDNLVAAIQNINKLQPHDPVNLLEIERFWRAINWILKALDEQLIVHGIRSMEVSPSIYEILFIHLHCQSEAILLLVIQALTALLQTAPESFWAAIGEARPFVVVEQVLSTRLFKQLLAQSLTFAIQSTDATGKDDVESVTTSWINTWIQSLKRNQKSDACEQLLHLLFEQVIHDANIGEQGKAACIRAGLDALDHVLRSFLDPAVNVISGTTSLYINSILNVTLKYNEVISDGASTKSQDQHTLGVPKAATCVISAALSLDSRVTAEEHLELRKNDHAAIQKTVIRKSADLWDAFLENLYGGQLTMAKTMLLAMAPLINVERFRPLRKDPDKLDPARKDFNNLFAKIAEVVGRVIQRLCEFTVEDLNQLCLGGHAIRPIIAFTVHGEDDISRASSELIKTITETSTRSDAITALLERHLSTTLSSMIFATRRIMEPSNLAWGPARHIINTAKDVLKSLSDLSAGILRSKTLDSGEQIAVTGWWVAHWKYIELAFQATGAWSNQVEIHVMQDFCRDVIELADAMLAQDGLFSSALQGGTSLPQAQELSKMQQLLKDPQRHLNGIVRMLRLRDLYLVEVTVKVVAKLLNRLRENDIEIPAEPKAFVQDSCVKAANGRYRISTNLSDQQRAELLKALGEDDDVEIIQISAVPRAEKPKKQSLLDAWSKSGTAASATSQTSRSNKEDVLELSSSVDKNRSILDKMAARQKPSATVTRPSLTALKPRVEPVVSKNALIESRKRAKAEKAKRDAEAIAKAKALRGPLVSGEGSGLKGLAGVVGKEHTPQKSQIMVDSDEEDEDDSEDEDLEKLISKGQQGQKAVDEATRRREKALLEKTRRPVKKVKVQRSAKDMRARLIPPMDQLHQAILEWDIFHDGNEPPSSSASIACTHVADTYEHPQEYKRTFLGLLISEAWRSFVTAKDETTSKPYGLKIASRMNVDKFLEVTASIPSAESKERMLSEGDIVLVSRGANPLADSSDAHALARIWKTRYKGQRLEVTYRLNSKNNPLLAANALGVGSELQAVKITNMTTIEREYAALESLQYYDLMSEVLNAEPSPILNYGEEAVSGVMQNYQLNPGQARAVLGARDNDGFTLIQGPPGTGKTKTIVAMVGSLLTGNIQAPGTAIKPKLPGQPRQNAMPKKLLVCAPSNAAVDELVLRLKAGVKMMSGSFHKINVLRLGRSDAINAAVRDVTLDELVKKRLEGDNTQNKAKEERDKIHNDAAKIRDELAELRPKLDEARANGDRNLSQALQRSVDQLRRAQINIGAKIDEDKASGNTLSREAEIRRRRIQQEVLDGAQVLCATLSGSGHEMFKHLNVEFETVIIDEAAQCVELSALIPLKYGCTKCILVGDPKQLPPTVLSQSAARYGYDQSLFVRMQRNHPDTVHMLDRQYRMHPEISLFPSLEFYEGKLVDGDDMSGLRRQPWHASSLLGPYRFFDVAGAQEKGNQGRSLVNHAELKVAMQLYERFRADFGRQCDIRGKIGIITPYKAQLQELRYQFGCQYGEGITEDIEFNTTDAFQGRECEIIIFSCVRASPTGGIGFMRDIRRMNVGLTRAKSSLWILGDSRALVQGEFWGKLIENARQRSLYTKGDILSMLRKPSAAKPLAAPSIPSPPGNSTAPTTDQKVQQPYSKEIEMTDAAAAPPPSYPRKTGPPPQQLATNYTVTERRPGAWECSNRIEVNERGEAQPAVSRHSDRPPIIQSSTSKQETKKRPSDANSAQRGPKRMTTEQNWPSSRPAPTGPKAMNNGPKESRQAKDPSAMVALGLTPAARPPPMETPSTSRAPSSSFSAAPNLNLPARPPAPNGTVVHRKKGKADPFIQRKPPRR